MGDNWVDDMKRRAGLKKRNIEDDETDTGELTNAGITLQQGDARVKTGLRQSTMTAAEKKKLVKWRTAK